jgi:ABC-type phosphate transport system substrate-binding protein
VEEEETVNARLRRPALKAALLIGALAAALGPAAPALSATSLGYSAISGAGSSWSAVALTQWAQNLQPNGLTINFNPNGSAAGRQSYMAGQVNFAASDPPFRNGSDPFASGDGENPSYGYSYVPDTAGGTAFMYHLTVAGHLITNLRLSPLTLVKIFTGQITNWDDPAITKDYGAQLPSIPIIPVVRSDGSGATYFLTRWMAHEFPSEWNAFCAKVSNNRVGTPGKPCTQTEFYPEQWGNSVAQNGSEAVASYITASFGQGAIGYDEYAYALNSHFPVVEVENPAGYYVLPTASNVAVALTQAQIDSDASSPNYLQQDLDNVYTFTDPRSYPLSSYSYLIVPRKGAAALPGFSNGDGVSLSTYIDYFLCAGQQYSAELGYSPLPLNLVEGGLAQAAKIPGAIAEPSLASNCANPTFSNGQLTVLVNAPQPSPCQKVGAPLECKVVDGKAEPTSYVASGPTTGTSTGTGTGVQEGPVTGTVVNLASDDNSTTLGALSATAIFIAIAVPPAIYALMRRRRRVRR